MFHAQEGDSGVVANDEETSLSPRSLVEKQQLDIDTSFGITSEVDSRNASQSSAADNLYARLAQAEEDAKAAVAASTPTVATKRATILADDSYDDDDESISLSPEKLSQKKVSFGQSMSQPLEDHISLENFVTLVVSPQLSQCMQ